MKNHVVELEELRERVGSDLRDLLRDIDLIDYDSLTKIAYAIGTLDKEDEGIELKVYFKPDNISQYFPEGTPYSVLLDCLDSIKETIWTRIDYEASDGLIDSIDDMYERFSVSLEVEMKNQYGYSSFSGANFIPDDEEFAMIDSALNNQQERVNLLVKLEPNQVYSIWELSQKPDWEEKLTKEIVEELLSNAVYVGNIRLSK